MEEDFKSKLTLLKKKGREESSSAATASIVADSDDKPIDKESAPSYKEVPSSSSSSSSNGYFVKWLCGECNNECLPVTLESRCLCGHRMKEHDRQNSKMLCKNSRCRCLGFYYIVAEGAWILRCQCKHRHTDHDCSTPLHPCAKCAGCKEFMSPWVCNCGHVWGSHHQSTLSTSTSARTASSCASRVIHSIRQDGIDG
jgi:hypothetical protein